MKRKIKRKIINKSFITILIINLMVTMPYGLSLTNKINNEIPILQWEGPHGEYQDYINNRSYSEFTIKEYSKDIQRLNSEVIILFVESNILTSIENEINIYNSNLNYAGYNTIILNISGGDAGDIKIQILTYWDLDYNITGVVLIGDLPVEWYHHENDFDGNPSEFPCDLFLMDLDGNWTDTDDDDMYDSHTDGIGDTAPEIYLGRIDASNIPGDEITILKDYFQKLDDYWKGIVSTSNIGFTYTDEDWAGYSDMRNDIGYAYENYEPIWYPNVNRDDYINNRLPGIYEFIQLACHSWSGGHSFSSGGYAYSSEIRNAPPIALFYNLFCCGTLRFTDYNCVGNAYILDTNSPSLTVVGSTKSGSMLDFRYFYEPLGQNYSFGKSFQKWFEYMAPYSDTPGGYNDISWFYGMTILGDPTLYINPISLQNTLVYVDDDFNEVTPGWNITHFNNIQQAIDIIEENETIYVYNGIYYENLLINKSITLEGENNSSTIIDGNSSGDVVFVTANYVDIKNFTIKNSYNSTYNFGILFFAANGNISNCIITDNGNGIELIYCEKINVYGNIIRNNLEFGVSIWSVNDSKVFDNIIINNGESGIRNYKSKGNIINNNFLKNNSKEGIYDWYSSDSIVYNNIVLETKELDSNWGDGIEVAHSSNCTIEDNYVKNNEGVGIILHVGSSNCSIINNIVDNNSAGRGIGAWGGFNGYIVGNMITNQSSSGIQVSGVGEEDFNGIIERNTISQNYYGISIGTDNNISTSFEIRENRIFNNYIGIDSNRWTNGGKIYHNNIHDNQLYDGYAYLESYHLWDEGYPSGGNYWSDFDESGEGAWDNNSDGIIDKSYVLPGDSNQDLYPLTNPILFLEISEGWNLITIPYNSFYNASELAENITNCSIISRFNSQHQTYESFIVGVSPPSADFEIQNGYSYFIESDNNNIFTFYDPPILNVTIPLFVNITGWNMIGWYNQNDTKASFLASNITNCSIVSMFDSINQIYKSYIVNVSPESADFTISQGMGVFVIVDEETIWYGN